LNSKQIVPSAVSLLPDDLRSDHVVLLPIAERKHPANRWLGLCAGEKSLQTSFLRRSLKTQACEIVMKGNKPSKIRFLVWLGEKLAAETPAKN